MVERRVPPKQTPKQYLADVKKAFNDEPEKYDEFASEILPYIVTHRHDTASCLERLERVKELMKDHQNLLHRFSAFLHPEDPEAKRTIVPPDANKGLGQCRTMVGREVPGKPTIDHSRLYITAVKEAFRDEPGKYVEFQDILNDFDAKRFDRTSAIARLKEFMKDHRELLLGFSFFFPDDDEPKRTIPHEPSRRTIPHEASRRTNLAEPKRTIPHEPSRRTNLAEPRRTIPLEAKKTVPPEAKTPIILKTQMRTIPPEAEHNGDESSCTKRKRVESDGPSFMDNLKTRFRSLDTHVVESFREIMENFKEGKMSEKQVHEEVVNLLYYHEDLIVDFPRCFKRNKTYRNKHLY